MFASPRSLSIALRATYQVDHELDDLRHELEVEQVRELVRPVAVEARVDDVEHVAQERRDERDAQDQELKAEQDEHGRPGVEDVETADDDERQVDCCETGHERHEAHVREARDHVRLLDLYAHVCKQWSVTGRESVWPLF